MNCPTCRSNAREWSRVVDGVVCLDDWHSRRLPTPEQYADLLLRVDALEREVARLGSNPMSEEPT